MKLRILHTNDMHGTLDQARFARLQALRAQADLYFESGDAIRTGNLGVPLRPEPVWPMLESLNCTASVPGNRESHVLAAAFEAKLKGATHPILCANLIRRDGSHPLPGSKVVQSKGVRVGVVAVMVAMVTRRMKTQAASAFLWDPPIPAALRLASELRPSVDLLIALTHIGYKLDLELAESGAFDIILGGHSHTVLKEPVRVGRTYVCQGGSHNHYAGLYSWDGELGGGLVEL